MRVTVEAIQILGGYGYVTEYSGRALLARRQDHPDHGGTNEIQRVVIASAMAR